MQQDSKWWGESMTIWGAGITAVATVLPALAPVFGVDISAEVAQKLGTDLTRFMQAAGGLVGTGMTIYGRARATTRLERRRVSVTV